MEIGNKNIGLQNLSKDPSLDSESIKHCHAVLNLKPNGLGVIISDKGKSKILGVGNYLWDSRSFSQNYLTKLEEILLALEFNFEDCLSNSWLVSANRTSLIPLGMFQNGSESHLLKLNSKQKQQDICLSDVWKEDEIVCCYAIPKVIDQWLNHNFSQSAKHHVAFSFSELYKHQSKTSTFTLLHLEDNYADLFIANNRRVIFYNQFDFSVKEDLLYYVLFALEQSRLIAPEVKLHLSGRYSKDLESLFSNYMGNVQKASTPMSFSISPQIPHSKLLGVFNLLGGL